jgi:hypothetical protein
MLADRRVDGLIVTGRRIEPRPAVDAGLGIPVVYAMTQPDGGELDGPAVLPDDVGGGAAAGTHLLETGRRHIAHITGPERFLAARLRAQGLRDALTRAGVVLPPGEVLYGEWSERWGREAAGMLLRRSPGTDAIFCGSDQIARGVGDALRAAGRRVPDDIALVGFDNWGPMALGADPPLSSVDMCLEDVGGRGGPAVGHRRRAGPGCPHRAVPPGGPRLQRCWLERPARALLRAGFLGQSWARYFARTDRLGRKGSAMQTMGSMPEPSPLPPRPGPMPEPSPLPPQPGPGPVPPGPGPAPVPPGPIPDPSLPPVPPEPGPLPA